MPVIFGPSGRHCIKNRHDSVTEITAWAQDHFRKSLSVNTVHRAIHKCKLKLYHAKKKPYVNTIQKRRHLLWAKAHLNWAKWKTVLWSDESKFEIVFGNHGRCVLRTKDVRDHPACYQGSVQKPASLMVWGCISTDGMGSLHIWKGTINAETYIEVLKQHMLPSRQRLFQGRPCIFQQDNAKPHTASITTAWLCRRRVCLQSRPFTKIHQHLAHHETKNKEEEEETKKTQDCSAARILYQKRMGQHSSLKTPATGLLQFPDVYGLLLKEEAMLHIGKHGPVPTFLRRVAVIKFKITLFFP